jgi:sirohydrochlorin ferrochelatase
MRSVAAAVGRAWAAPVVAAFLDFDRPSIPDTLETFAAVCEERVPIVVPALLTDAYHGRIDLPGVLARAPQPARLARVLGPDPLLLAALRRRLSELDSFAELAARTGGGPGVDAVVLIAAGTSDPAARSTVDGMAVDLGRAIGVPCRAAYASASGPTAGEAVVALRARGARHVVVASYFLAPGLLYASAARSAMAAGAVGVAAPIGAAPELVRLVMARAGTAGSADTKKAPVALPGRFS